MWRNFLEGGPVGRQRARMREKKGGCRRSGAKKVAAAEIVGKANPGNRGGFLTGRVVGQAMLADR